MAVCAEGDPVKWSHLRDVCGTIMAAASVLGVDVEDPRSQPESPFAATGPYDVTLAQNFDVDEAAVVTAAYLTSGLGSYVPWDPPETWMHTLGEATDLIFVSEADACWCKHMWRVMPNGDGYTLEDTGSSGVFGCCPSIPVPVRGDTLDYSQNFIPAGWVDRYAKGSFTTVDDARTIDVPKCVLMQNGVQFKEEKIDDVLRLSAAQREVKGHLTWIIRPAHFQTLYDLIKAVVADACGVKADTVKKYDTEEYLCEMAVPTMRDIIFSLEGEFGGYSDPGCLEVEGCDNIKLPWEESTCGAETCEDSGAQKVYCNTLEFLDALANSLVNMLNEKDFTNACGLSCESTRNKNLVQYKTTPNKLSGVLYMPGFEGEDGYSGGSPAGFIGEVFSSTMECPESIGTYEPVNGVRPVCYTQIDFDPTTVYTEVASATFDVTRTTMRALIESVLPEDAAADTLHCREQGRIRLPFTSFPTAVDAAGQTIQERVTNFSGPHTFACGSSTLKRCTPQICLNASAVHVLAAPLGLCGNDLQPLRNAAIGMENMLAHGFVTYEAGISGSEYPGYGTLIGALGFMEQSQVVRRVPGANWDLGKDRCEDARDAGSYSRGDIPIPADLGYGVYSIRYTVRGFCPKARSETPTVSAWYKTGNGPDVCATAGSYAFAHAFENECP